MFKYEFLQRFLRIANVAKRVVLQGFTQESKCVQGCIFCRNLLGILNVTKIRLFSHLSALHTKCIQRTRFSCLLTIGNLTICSGSPVIKN